MIQQLIEGFIQQMEKAIDLGKNQRLKHKPQDVRQLVVSGLGGSGIGANIAESILQQELSIPFIIVKTYQIPQFVDAHTLFVASSFSGNTEETLAAFQQAQQRQAQIACISAGGELLQQAEKNGYDFVQLPNEAPCPRAFLGYSLINLLYLLKNYGFISNAFEAQLQEAVALLKTQKQHIHQEAKEIANAFYQKLPIVYADSPWLPIITRLQQQVNENAKQLCHTHVFPEMNHNELVGWGLSPELYAKTCILMVRSNLDHPRTRLRFDICKPIFAEKAQQVIEAIPQGENFLTQCFYLIHLFDWVSWYLSELNQVDAFEVQVINNLKSALAKVPS
ncbi:MAG TPA: bifunctional phosphoglucose/phosphomannose isomerase [Microscillaceae bacterium]|jgi:glucose/mannose-6-phosphate isomerase|nr:bifunctional phosphoglucose/phosphomannose isomerase [Microscillaceae bacterium]